MDPLTALGALASAAQLLGTALEISRSAYGLLSALKHADEHAQKLRKGESYVPGIHRFAPWS